MKQDTSTKPQPPKSLAIAVYRMVLAVFLILLAVLLVGSLYGVLRPATDEPLFRLGGHETIVRGGGPESGDFTGDGYATFSGIGRLRIPLSGEPPATVVLSVSFPYPANDVFFAEELATRVGEFRSIATGYFSGLSQDDISGFDEERAKAEILSGYNELLHLGKIETLFFTDLIILD